MAFAYTVSGRDRVGRRWRTWGTWTNGAADSGGNIVTGLRTVETANIGVSSHLGTEIPKMTLNSTAGYITLVTSEGADGYWEAVGF